MAGPPPPAAAQPPLATAAGQQAGLSGKPGFKQLDCSRELDVSGGLRVGGPVDMTMIGAFPGGKARWAEAPFSHCSKRFSGGLAVARRRGMLGGRS